MATIFSTHKGRMVQGDAFTPQTKDQQGNPLVVKTGPNAGQPTQSFFIAVAFAKNDPETPALLEKFKTAAVEGWPAYFPTKGVGALPPLFGSTHPRFSMKIMDGDGVDDNGRPNNQKEGFAGHWVIKFSSSFAPKVYEAGKYDEMARVDIDKAKHSLLKRGYFVRVGFSLESNNNDQRPGLYCNLAMVEIVHAGPEITSGPDASAVFGGGTGQTINHAAPPPALPVPGAAGIVAVPGAAYSIEALRAGGWSDDQIVAAGYAVRPAPVPAAPLPVPVPVPGVPSPGVSTPPVPGAPSAMPSPSSPPPAPYTGYMQAAPAAPARVMLPAAGGAPYEQFIAAGWTDAQLVAQGMMAP